MHRDPGSLRHWQVPGDQLHQARVEFDDRLPGARPGRRRVPRQGQRAATEVQQIQPEPRLCRTVQDVRETAYVLELQVQRIVEVHVRLRRPVDGQQPGPLPVHVRHQFGGALAHFPDHRDLFVAHPTIVGPGSARPDIRGLGDVLGGLRQARPGRRVAPGGVQYVAPEHLAGRRRRADHQHPRPRRPQAPGLGGR